MIPLVSQKRHDVANEHKGDGHRKCIWKPKGCKDGPVDQKATDKNGQHEPDRYKEQFRVGREVVVAIVTKVQEVERSLILWWG